MLTYAEYLADLMSAQDEGIEDGIPVGNYAYDEYWDNYDLAWAWNDKQAAIRMPVTHITPCSRKESCSQNIDPDTGLEVST